MKIGYYHHVSVTLYCCMHVSSREYIDKLRDHLHYIATEMWFPRTYSQIT